MDSNFENNLNENINLQNNIYNNNNNQNNINSLNSIPVNHKKGLSGKIFFYALLSIFIIIILFQVYQYNELNKKFETQNQQLKDFMTQSQEQIDELNSINSKLNDENNKLYNSLLTYDEEYKKLNDSYNQLSNNYETLGVSHIELQSNLDKTINKIEDFESELTHSLDWFSENAEITDVTNENRIKNALKGKCFDIDDDNCLIKLGCFYFVNDNKLNYKYKYDSVTSGVNDQLQSIEEFIHNWGGDCEDYSLFYKAEYNYALDYCQDQNTDQIILDAWIPETNENYPLTYDPENIFFLSNAKNYILPKDYSYPNIICGSIYNYYTQTVSGHCILAFTKNKIDDIEDITIELNNAPMIEPQNGMYMGLVNNDESGIYLVDSNKLTEQHPSWINMIITDNDLYLFSTKHSEWMSYSSQITALESEKEKLTQLK